MKNILITGANRGIGLSLSKHYTNAGHCVIACCRKTSNELNRLQNVVLIEEIDMLNQNSFNKVPPALEGKQIDILINNAGIFLNETLDDFNSENIQKQLMVNSVAPLVFSHKLLPHISKGGKIAMVTSRMGSIADNDSGGYFGYRMSKAALNAGTKSLSVDLASKGIAVGLFHPGFVATDMTNKQGDIDADTAAQRIIDRIEELNMDNTGSFWHSNGASLPW